MTASAFTRCILRPAALVAVFAVLALAADTALACPSCQAALAAGGDDGQHGDIIGGYMWSIIFMMSMPFTLLAAFGLYFYCKIKQAAKAQRPLSGQSTPARIDSSAPPLALQE